MVSVQYTSPMMVPQTWLVFELFPDHNTTKIFDAQGKISHYIMTVKNTNWDESNVLIFSLSLLFITNSLSFSHVSTFDTIVVFNTQWVDEDFIHIISGVSLKKNTFFIVQTLKCCNILLTQSKNEGKYCNIHVKKNTWREGKVSKHNTKSNVVNHNNCWNSRKLKNTEL